MLLSSAIPFCFADAAAELLRQRGLLVRSHDVESSWTDSTPSSGAIQRCTCSSKLARSGQPATVSAIVTHRAALDVDGSHHVELGDRAPELRIDHLLEGLVDLLPHGLHCYRAYPKGARPSVPSGQGGSAFRHKPGSDPGLRRLRSPFVSLDLVSDEAELRLLQPSGQVEDPDQELPARSARGGEARLGGRRRRHRSDVVRGRVRLVRDRDDVAMVGGVVAAGDVRRPAQEQPVGRLDRAVCDGDRLARGARGVGLGDPSGGVKVALELAGEGRWCWPRTPTASVPISRSRPFPRLSRS